MPLLTQHREVGDTCTPKIVPRPPGLDRAISPGIPVPRAVARALLDPSEVSGEAHAIVGPFFSPPSPLALEHPQAIDIRSFSRIKGRRRKNELAIHGLDVTFVST
ncbi:MULTISPECIES: hypothetical protein [Frankia]|uniref:hypothetical protein n=1 Tax=Frankia TaxID=1854 RepID=UPI0012FF8234|nr:MULTISPECIES: hypothetical protein [Frankia]